MRTFLIALLITIAAAAPARADLKQYIDAGTLMAGEVDLTKADFATIDPWVRQAMTAAGLLGNSPSAVKPAELDGSMAAAKKVVADLRAAGATKIYFVTQLDLLKNGGVAVIAPIAAGGDAKKVAAIFFSGRADGPTSQPAVDRGQSRFQRAAVVLPGNVVVHGSLAAVNYVKTLHPIDRTDLNAGLAAMGDVPVKFVVAASPPIRMMLAKNLPEKLYGQPMTTVTNDLLWVAAGVTLPPEPTVKVIAQSANPESAKSLEQIVTYQLAELSGVPPTISPDFAKLLTPQVKNDQVTLNFDNARLMNVAKELTIPLAQSRQNAIRAQTMSNMRQILMACQMFAAENKGKLPKDLKSLDKYLGANVKRVMTNPLNPTTDPGFIYIPLPDLRMPNAGQTVMLYAAHKEFGQGVCVGFADGHVEFVNDKKRFDEMTGNAALDGAMQ